MTFLDLIILFAPHFLGGLIAGLLFGVMLTHHEALRTEQPPAISWGVHSGIDLKSIVINGLALLLVDIFLNHLISNRTRTYSHIPASP